LVGIIISFSAAFGKMSGVVMGQVTSPTGTKVMSVTANEGQKFEFQAHQSGLYKFCFTNPGPTPETISFHIHVGHIPGIADLAKDGKLQFSPSFFI
jgi:hypothetical protein